MTSPVQISIDHALQAIAEKRLLKELQDMLGGQDT